MHPHLTAAFLICDKIINVKLEFHKNNARLTTAFLNIRNLHLDKISPSEAGVMLMQYVTYSDLFQFALVIIGIIGLVISAVCKHKKK